MNLTVEPFRQPVEESRGERRRGAPRYPKELVAFAVKHAREAQRSGCTPRVPSLDRRSKGDPAVLASVRCSLFGRPTESVLLRAATRELYYSSSHERGDQPMKRLQPAASTAAKTLAQVERQIQLIPRREVEQLWFRDP